MLTIRINGLDGNQEIFEASVVVRRPASLPGSAGALEFTSGGVECHAAAHFGHVYVMNDHGKTVAAYDLGKWDEDKPAARKA
jgi:hypothetical protein